MQETESQGTRDISSKYIERFEELQEVEKGIPYKEFYYHSRARDKALEFRILKKITETNEHAKLLVENCAMTCGMNRYADILPYKDTLVKAPGHSYINASFVDASVSDKMFIATQGPMKGTMDAFWSMIWEYDVKLIIMMCSIQEEGMKKCEQYFPLDGTITCENFEITLFRSVNKYDTLIEKILCVTENSTQQSKYVSHLQSTAWPDQSTPNIQAEFHSINYIISSIKKRIAGNPHSKIAVHCSAGIGRTGVLVGIYSMVTSLEDQIKKELSGEEVQPCVSVFGTVRKMREQRWGMVACLKQYKFLYKYMEYWITSFLTHLQHETF